MQSSAQHFPQRLAGQPVEDFIQKAEDDELLRLAERDAARQKIEEFLDIHLAARRAVGATHIVSFDFEAGCAVRLGFVGEQEIAYFLIRVRLVRAGVHADEAGEDRA